MKFIALLNDKLYEFTYLRNEELYIIGSMVNSEYKIPHENVKFFFEMKPKIIKIIKNDIAAFNSIIFNPAMPVLTFWSNASTQECYEKSNFYYAPFVLKPEHLSPAFAKVNPEWITWIPKNGITFTSSEHCWQSLKACNEKTFKRFTQNGDLGSFKPESFVPFVDLNKSDKQDPQKVADACAKKYKHWSPKLSVGIIPKMAANAKYRIACGFSVTDMKYDREILSADLERDIWHVILYQKFIQNPKLKQNLLNSKGKYLLEFDRGAAQRQVHWGGYITPEKKLLGENVMGIYMMQVRDRIINT